MKAPSRGKWQRKHEKTFRLYRTFRDFVIVAICVCKECTAFRNHYEPLDLDHDLKCHHCCHQAFSAFSIPCGESLERVKRAKIHLGALRAAGGQLQVKPNAGFLNQLGLKVRELCFCFLPPFHWQDTSYLCIWEHFRPQFVWDEFCLGVHATLRIFGFLSMIGWLSYVILLSILPDMPSLPTNLLPRPSLFHHVVLIGREILFSAPPLNIQTDSWVQVVLRVWIIGPIWEEIIFRGLGYSFFDRLCKWHLSQWKRVVNFLHGANLRPLGLIVPMLALPCPDLTNWDVLPLLHWTWQTAIPRCWMLLIMYRVLRSARVISSPDVGAASRVADTVHNVHEEKTKIETTQLRKDSTELLRGVETRNRWLLSAIFAASHVPMNGGASSELASSEQYVAIRRFLGVFFSSFCLESRLYASRGTLWGCIGAHVAFNFLITLRLLMEERLLLIREEIQLSPMPWWFLVVGLGSGAQFLLYSLSNGLGIIDKKELAGI